MDESTSSAASRNITLCAAAAAASGPSPPSKVDVHSERKLAVNAPLPVRLFFHSKPLRDPQMDIQEDKTSNNRGHLVASQPGSGAHLPARQQ
jgi:hypothetical protein